MKSNRFVMPILIFLTALSVLFLGNSSVKSKRLRHVVAFSYKAEVTPDQKLKVTREFYNLKKHIPAILEFEGGEDINAKTSNKKFTHCFVVTVKDEKELGVYGSHPKHKAFSALADPLLAEVMVVDYWAD